MKRQQRMRPGVSPEQYRRFVQAHETAVYTFCVYMLGDRKRAEVAAEAAFVDSFPTDACVKVLAHAYRRCLREAVEKITAVDVPPMLAHLDPPARALVALRYACHLHPDELSTVTGQPPIQVRRLLNQARLQMATGLAVAHPASKSPPNRSLI